MYWYWYLWEKVCIVHLCGGRYGDQENMKVRTESILKALDLCLDNNLFSFNEKFYQQVGGVGTGVKLAPHMHA